MQIYNRAALKVNMTFGKHIEFFVRSYLSQDVAIYFEIIYAVVGMSEHAQQDFIDVMKLILCTPL